MKVKNDWHNEDHTAAERRANEVDAAAERLAKELRLAVLRGEVAGVTAIPVRNTDMAIVRWKIVPAGF